MSSVKGGYLLRARYVKGEIQRFSTTTSALGSDVPRSAGLAVLDVRKGVATIRLNVATPRDAKTGDLRGLPLKNVLKLDRLNRMQGSHAGSNLVIQYPPNPIRIGGTWVVDSSLQLGKSMGVELKLEYRLDSVQQRGRKRVATLSYQMQGMASGSGTATIYASDGSLLSSSTNMVMNALGQSYPVRLRVRRL